MSQAALIETINRLMAGDYDPVAAIVEGEVKRGHAVVRPGDVAWLPARDWVPATVCSIAGSRARLVLIHAKIEGHGAFTRLLEAIKDAGLTPAVIDPTRKLAATLRRRKWRGRTVGRAFETRESVWTSAFSE